MSLTHLRLGINDVGEEMDRDGVNQLPVLAEHQVLGMLSRDSVISFLGTARELGA